MASFNAPLTSSPRPQLNDWHPASRYPAPQVIVKVSVMRESSAGRECCFGFPSLSKVNMAAMHMSACSICITLSGILPNLTLSEHI